ncbi:MAG: hypothetical protein ACLPY3_15490 [Solirubrobacteraceae bacterium]
MQDFALPRGKILHALRADAGMLEFARFGGAIYRIRSTPQKHPVPVTA